MPILILDLLGDLKVHSPSGELINLSAKKSQALLSYLAVKPSQRVSRDKMASLLWSSTGPDQARQSLRQLLSTLRKELGQIAPDQKLLIEEADFLRVDPALVTADVAEFEALAASGSEESLVRASEMYTGDLLEGFLLNEERFDQWVMAERDRLHRMAVRVHGQLIEQQTRRGETDAAIETAQRSLRLDMLQEPVHRTLIRLYMKSGDFAEALQQYDTLARALKRELGVDPDSESRALHQQISLMRLRRSSHDTAEEPGRGNGGKKILVVEDNVLSREVANAVLKAAGYSVLLAKDGAEALMLMGREQVDLILLDIDLPFVDGHTVLEALKEKGINVPAIFVSGLPGEEPELKALQIGAADFIHKPVKNSVLLARVKRVLGE